MAEAVGLASGLLALVNVAFQSSIALYNTVRSFRDHPKRVRDLEEELEALNEVLLSLTDTVGLTTGVDLSALELPLRRCGNACKEFEDELVKCVSRSGADRTSFRDWARLRYMGDNIDSFRLLLAGYKSTINVALADASLRRSAITAEDLGRYRDMIKTTTDDLQAHLQSINEKLALIIAQNTPKSDSDARELRLIHEEQQSTRKCLEICAQLTEHINQLQLDPGSRTQGAPGPDDAEAFPERVTNAGLRDCRQRLSYTAAELERHMQDLLDRLVTKSKITAASEDDIANLARLQEEWKTTRQGLHICSNAEEHLKESISIIDNYSTGDDTIQFLVSTSGKTIHGKNRGFGYLTRQVGGHLNDDSVQRLSRDFAGMRVHSSGEESPAPSKKTSSVPDGGDEAESGPSFRDRHGRGVTLMPKSTPST